ncbi:MAG: c-type cytochrome domain-containing protein, partial [Planctomycetota bacterium]
MPPRSLFLRSRGLPLALALISSLAGCEEGPEWIASSSPGPVAQPETPRATAVEPVRYGRDVRPILADRCFICHGPDAAKRKAEMRLDQFESATTLRDGIAPIAPGDPERSELLRRVACADPDDVMPPADSNKRAI